VTTLTCLERYDFVFKWIRKHLDEVPVEHFFFHQKHNLIICISARFKFTFDLTFRTHDENNRNMYMCPNSLVKESRFVIVHF
jgi:hypothetical protein